MRRAVERQRRQHLGGAGAGLDADRIDVLAGALSAVGRAEREPALLEFQAADEEVVDGCEHDTRGGRLIPTTSVDQYVATLARWYGVPQGQISTVVPNVTRFATDDLGFMQLIP